MRDLRFRIFIGLRHSDKRGCKIRRVLSVTSARYQCCVYAKLLSGLKGPRMLFRVKARNLGKGALLSLYYTLNFPNLTYCNQVWGSTYKYNIDTLTKLQKKAVRIICSVKPFSHTDGLYKELGLLKVTEIYHFLVGQFMLDIITKILPKLFDEYFTKHSEVHGYSTRQSELYRLPDYKKDLGRPCISFTGVKMWIKINCC